MRYDELSIKIAKGRFGDRKLTTDALINILSLFVESSICLELSAEWLLYNEKELLEKYEDHLDKRFDFVDLKHKRIYEFDDELSFKFATLFDRDYAPREKQTYDAIKLQIIVDAGYDLVRVTRDTLCNEFINILLNNKFVNGSSYVISGDNITVTSTESLIDDIEQLKEIITRLRVENDNLKKQLSNAYEMTRDCF